MKDHGSSKADGGLKLRDLASAMSGMKIVADGLTEDERDCFIRDSHSNLDAAVDFELFLRVCSISFHPISLKQTPVFPKVWCCVVDSDLDWELQVYLKMQGRIGAKSSSSAFLMAATTTLLHTISESEKASYVNHINNYLGDDAFLKKYLPIDPMTNDLFEISKDGVLLW